MFKLLGNCWTIFQNEYVILQPQQQCMMVKFIWESVLILPSLLVHTVNQSSKFFQFNILNISQNCPLLSSPTTTALVNPTSSLTWNIAMASKLALVSDCSSTCCQNELSKTGIWQHHCPAWHPLMQWLSTLAPQQNHQDRFQISWCPGCTPGLLNQNLWRWDPGINSVKSPQVDPI